MPLRDKFLRLYQVAKPPYAELSKKSGVSTATISRVINGGTASVENLESLIGVLEADGAVEYEAPHIPADHCDRCRAEQNEHNRILREDFNVRFEEMRNAYEERIKETKGLYAQRHEMHEAEKARIQTRLRWVSIAFAVLALFNTVILAIDVLHGGVGWFRFLNGGTRNAISDVIKYLASWLA